jgi:hypothetical protein
MDSGEEWLKQQSRRKGEMLWFFATHFFHGRLDRSVCRFPDGLPLGPKRKPYEA